MGDQAHSMLPHLAAAAKAARRRERCKQIEVAIRLGVHEDSISKFERALVWPQNPDATIRAYADELGINPLELWADALRRWEESLPSR